jgi:cytochrome c-type biogenesis protein CcmE
MRQIDRELADAVKATPGEGLSPEPKIAAEEAGPESKPGVERPAPAPRKPKRNIGMLLSLGAVTFGVMAIALTIGEDASFAKTVDRLVADRARMVGRPVNVQGTLVKGSLAYQDNPCEYRFSLASGGVELPVRYPVCVVPDNFRDAPESDVEVTASGKLAPGGGFEATKVMAKCPSKQGYQPASAAAKR